MRLSKGGFDSSAEGGGLGYVGADDEDGVVSGDGADDLGPALVVDAGGYGGGSSGAGDEDDEVESLFGFEGEVLKDVLDVEGVYGYGGLLLGEAISARPFGEVELAHVAREGGLRDVEAAAGELEAEFILAGDAGSDEVADGGLSFGLHG
jgi:hypothetical protein